MLDLLVLRSLCPCVGAVQASTSWIYGTIWSRNPWELLCHAKPFQNKWMRRCKLWQGEKSITANVLWLWAKKTEMPFMWTLFEAEHVWRKSGNPDVPKPGKCCLHLAADWIQHIGTSFFCSSSDHQLLSAQHISTHWALIVATSLWNHLEPMSFCVFFPAQETPILEASDVLNMHEIHDGLKGMAKPWNPDRTASPFHDTARMLSNCQEDEPDFCGSRSNFGKRRCSSTWSILLSQVTVSFLRISSRQDHLYAVPYLRGRYVVAPRNQSATCHELLNLWPVKFQDRLRNTFTQDAGSREAVTR